MKPLPFGKSPRSKKPSGAPKVRFEAQPLQAGLAAHRRAIRPGHVKEGGGSRRAEARRGRRAAKRAGVNLRRAPQKAGLPTTKGGSVKASARKQLGSSKFGLPEERKYLIHDRSHAGNAKARAKQMLKRGKLSPAQYAKVVRRANAVLAA